MGHDPSKRTTIKIAAKDASQRNSGAPGAADPGPGDPSAAPSVAPQLVDIPDAPTPSQLVVKSTSAPSRQQGSNFATLHGANSMPGASKRTGGSKSHTGSTVSASASTSTTGLPKSSTGRPKSATGTGPKSAIMASMAAKQPAESNLAGPQFHAGPSATGPSEPAARESTSSKLLGGPSGAPSDADSPATPPATVSTAMQADSGAVHDEVEDGEGELEQPEGTGSPAPGGGAAASSGTAPPTGPPASGRRDAVSGTSGTGATSATPGGAQARDKKKKKVTKFRYHKRITVRTSGKQSPSVIMEKVNKKDHKVALTPSTIEQLEPQELMRRAGIKGTQSHWRVRLRQTKRLTKNGQTTTQTKVAYRDSEGNKRVVTSSSPFCKQCGKKLEECKCDGRSERGEQ